eukprot:11189279-Lingulodinium_polyedra.AAC.1
MPVAQGAITAYFQRAQHLPAAQTTQLQQAMHQFQTQTHQAIAQSQESTQEVARRVELLSVSAAAAT